MEQCGEEYDRDKKTGRQQRFAIYENAATRKGNLTVSIREELFSDTLATAFYLFFSYILNYIFPSFTLSLILIASFVQASYQILLYLFSFSLLYFYSSLLSRALQRLYFPPGSLSLNTRLAHIHVSSLFRLLGTTVASSLSHTFNLCTCKHALRIMLYIP